MATQSARTSNAGDDQYPAQFKEILAGHQAKWNLAVSVHLLTLIAFLRCGLTSLLRGDKEASFSDVLWVLLEEGDDGLKKMKVAAATHGLDVKDALDVIHRHLDLQRQKFTYRRKGDVGSTREVIASPARPVNPFNWNFPRLVRNEQERLVPARGFSHGGPRQGTEYEAMARQAGRVVGGGGSSLDYWV
ncbi:hypothetical protein CLOM_g10747 [Closterium sp. NIES-68]|nr:hypothetical protein CLOM_g10747 [Closterium sp. NIES-68]